MTLNGQSRIKASEELGQPLPFVKHWRRGVGQTSLTAASISSNSEELENEVCILKRVLKEHGVRVGNGGDPIRLEITSVTFPPIRSAHRDKIIAQGYRLLVNDKGVLIQAGSSCGIYYGIQSLAQMIEPGQQIARGEVLDWPDTALRIVMVDPARQNETPAYYRRIIEFCGRYKVNLLQMHLTDDEGVSLYHKDYKKLMNPKALKPSQVKDLVAFAKRHHVEIMPEIESLGHCEVFSRDPRAEDILHDLAGDRCILCPASEQSYEFLDAMYRRCAEVFPYPVIHIGCDEVKPRGRCPRCEKNWPGISYDEWYAKHVLRCKQIAAKYGRTICLWGDHMLQNPGIMARLPAKDMWVMDWQYYHVPVGTSAMLKGKGFYVIASSSLMCYPRVIFTDKPLYDVIQQWGPVVREQDLSGMQTTLWKPKRYLADAIWPGLAFFAVHSWAGSNWNERAFYSRFMEDFFGSSEGPAFMRAWKGLAKITWHEDEFSTSLWTDVDGCTGAKKYASEHAEEIGSKLEQSLDCRRQLARIQPTVKKNQIAWGVLEQSAAIQGYSMERILLAKEAYVNGEWNKPCLGKLHDSWSKAMIWLEEDWARNRIGGFSDHSDHLNSVRHVHDFHERTLKTR